MPPRPTGLAAAWRWLEMAVLFFVVPGLLALFVDPEQRAKPIADSLGLGFVFDLTDRPTAILMPALVVFTLLVLLWLIVDRRFATRQLWNWKPFRADARRIVLLFVLGGLAMVAIAWCLATFTDLLTVTRPDGQQDSALWMLPRRIPLAVVLILIFYPWFSAYPQEITHRAFFFHRYEGLFPPTGVGRRVFFLVNALAFAWLHAPFWNWIALALTFPGGLLFAWTYHRTRSALAAGMEHGLYGWWAFTVGLGYFVFTGSIGS